MKRPSPASLSIVVALVILAACAPRIGAPPQAPPDIVETEAIGATETLPATVAAAPPAPPDLPVEIGSTFRYFDGALLVAVPEGPFIMGQGGPDNPIRTVNLSEFWIYKDEVTNRMYSLCVDLGKCSAPDAADNPGFGIALEGRKPVVGLTWQQAADYCEFAHGRLPTEAQWEKAARGPEGSTYPWGNDPPTCDLLNFNNCVRRISDIGQYPEGKSYYDALDLAGNVYEWNLDWYRSDYYGAAPTQDPSGPDTGTKRSVRSSAYDSEGFLTEVARRFSEDVDHHRPDLGFRCVVEDPLYFAPWCTQLIAYGKAAPVGAGGGDDIVPICTEPQIQQFEQDNCKETYVWVKPGGPGDASSGLDQCTYMGQQLHLGEMWDLYICKVIVDIEVCGTCEYPLPGEASCPPGYSQDADLCSVDAGWPGQCPEGATYDEQSLCCTTALGPGASYNICDVESYDYIPGDPGSCVNYLKKDPVCVGLTVTFKTSCGKPNDPCVNHPDDPECQPQGCDPQTDPNCNPQGCNPTTGAGCQPDQCQGPNCPPTTCQPGSPNCPAVCLPPGTLIDTPSGPVAVQDLGTGDTVWTRDLTGAKVGAEVLATSRVPVSSLHEVLHIELADGRELKASPGHPTVDGRSLSDLAVGDLLDGSVITRISATPYSLGFTYDLLPSGPTASYWADGILVGSTLSGDQ